MDIRSDGIVASAHGEEEDWYADVPAQFLETYGNNSFANGYGSWREVQMLIDGQVADTIWPAPRIYPGGMSPGLWVPIVGLNAFDLKSEDVDVSPWLGILCNGHSHTFALNVVSYSPTSKNRLGTVARNWYVSGQVSLWLDADGHQTTGQVNETEDPSHAFLKSYSLY